jgi:hypothetical protein
MDNVNIANTDAYMDISSLVHDTSVVSTAIVLENKNFSV